ncbi:MAG: GDSL-type esterase/lipase family protein [Kiritimatiellae bacterium]|nr:GDSL-type esterase/lipase family protein [Kiritimatiellia bacterium]
MKSYSFVLITIFLMANAVVASEVSTSPLPKINSRIQQRFAASQSNEYDYVFMGDSITHGWEGKGKSVYAQHFADKKILNVATSGDRTEHTIWVIDNVNWKKVGAKVAMLMIGTNNTGHRPVEKESPEDTFEGIKVILEKMKEQAPDTKILLLAIFPRSANDTDQPRVRNDKVNAMIAKLADNQRVFFLDINQKLLEEDGKTLSKEVMPDLLHPNEKGYAIWAEAVKAKLEELAR